MADERDDLKATENQASDAADAVRDLVGELAQLDGKHARATVDVTLADVPDAGEAVENQSRPAKVRSAFQPAAQPTYPEPTAPPSTIQELIRRQPILGPVVPPIPPAVPAPPPAFQPPPRAVQPVSLPSAVPPLLSPLTPPAVAAALRGPTTKQDVPELAELPGRPEPVRQPMGDPRQLRELAAMLSAIGGTGAARLGPRDVAALQPHLERMTSGGKPVDIGMVQQLIRQHMAGKLQVQSPGPLPVAAAGPVPIQSIGAIPVQRHGPIPVTMPGAIPVQQTSPIPVRQPGPLPGAGLPGTPERARQALDVARTGRERVLEQSVVPPPPRAVVPPASPPGRGPGEPRGATSGGPLPVNVMNWPAGLTSRPLVQSPYGPAPDALGRLGAGFQSAASQAFQGVAHGIQSLESRLGGRSGQPGLSSVQAAEVTFARHQAVASGSRPDMTMVKIVAPLPLPITRPPGTTRGMAPQEKPYRGGPESGPGRGVGGLMAGMPGAGMLSQLSLPAGIISGLSAASQHAVKELASAMDIMNNSFMSETQKIRALAVKIPVIGGFADALISFVDAYSGAAEMARKGEVQLRQQQVLSVGFQQIRQEMFPLQRESAHAQAMAQAHTTIPTVLPAMPSAAGPPILFQRYERQVGIEREAAQARRETVASAAALDVARGKRADTERKVATLDSERDKLAANVKALKAGQSLPGQPQQPQQPMPPWFGGMFGAVPGGHAFGQGAWGMFQGLVGQSKQNANYEGAIKELAAKEDEIARTRRELAADNRNVIESEKQLAQARAAERAKADIARKSETLAIAKEDLAHARSAAVGLGMMHPAEQQFATQAAQQLQKFGINSLAPVQRDLLSRIGMGDLLEKKALQNADPQLERILADIRKQEGLTSTSTFKEAAQKVEVAKADLNVSIQLSEATLAQELGKIINTEVVVRIEKVLQEAVWAVWRKVQTEALEARGYMR